ncbi:MAG TPA: GNAT family N-acetyltransferase [Pyrinomonadaceae bacterium]|nr:GNAT family N-acetyltransferase [Pyrinomonadaceae bacterium]
MPSPTIRRAQTNEAAALSQIARDAKKYWGYPDSWLEHWRDELTISADFVDANVVYVFEHDGDVQGFYGLILRNDKAELEHLWVSPKHIGTGVGKELFIHAMQQAAGEQISEVQLTADPNAEGFYQKMGAYRIGDVRADMDENPRIIPRLAVKPKKSK